MDKLCFRKESIKRLRKAASKPHYGIDKRLSSLLKRYIKRRGAKSVLFYYPLPIEVDIRDTLRDLRREGLEIYIPSIEDKSFKMVKYRLPLEKDRFGTLRPKSSSRAYHRVDLVVVPVIAVDGQMRRIGFGKGMYDRFIPSLKKRADIVFIQRIGSKTKKVITDAYDISCDAYFFSKEIMIKRSRDVRGFIHNHSSGSRFFGRFFHRKKCTIFKEPST